MATIGQQLTAPEAGWKRYDDGQNIFYSNGSEYTGGSSAYYAGTQHDIIGADSYLQFKFVGTKLRIIGTYYSNQTSSADVYIDAVKVGNYSRHCGALYQCFNLCAR